MLDIRATDCVRIMALVTCETFGMSPGRTIAPVTGGAPGSAPGQEYSFDHAIKGMLSDDLTEGPCKAELGAEADAPPAEFSREAGGAVPAPETIAPWFGWAAIDDTEMAGARAVPPAPAISQEKSDSARSAVARPMPMSEAGTGSAAHSGAISDPEPQEAGQGKVAMAATEEAQASPASGSALVVQSGTLTVPASPAGAGVAPAQSAVPGLAVALRSLSAEAMPRQDSAAAITFAGAPGRGRACADAIYRAPSLMLEPQAGEGGAVAGEAPPAGAGDLLAPTAGAGGESLTNPTGSAPSDRGGASQAAALAPTMPDLSPSSLRQIAEAVARLPDRPLELTLTPEELGRVRMTMSTSDTGITVTVQSDRPETLDLLRRNIDLLARDFRDLGFTSVTFSFGEPPGRRPGGCPSGAEDLVVPVAAATSAEVPLVPINAAPMGSGLDLRI